MTTSFPKLYHTYFVKKCDERKELFRVLSEQFLLKKGLYPGSFVHVTPSFFIREMVYVDTDNRCKKFFFEKKTTEFIIKKRQYSQKPIVRFHHTDFLKEIAEEKNTFDILISLYSGFVSKYCRKYLKKEGILLVNNSHGDASLAFLDKNFKFIGVFKRNGERFKFVSDDLNTYFITKTGKPIERAKIESTMRGAGFTRTAYAYIFKRVA